ncbi:ribosome biogenesis protein BRX1 homolog, putative [Plasmodium chabaudi chabaudi]|uniref:Ribosome biogenesis protein BRX1 homolog, putative n=1 Tax=Plasmodium chabaudi chabaudi TaxID=31271 RepID=A0A1C6X269_PLACU|nr:ribosome biogenesis protein BRX1 homolog, putative [Plasmodium chabaudi chabaudi]
MDDINDETEYIKETNVEVEHEMEKEGEHATDLVLEKKRKDHASNDDLPEPKKMPLIEEGEEDDEEEEEEEEEEDEDEEEGEEEDDEEEEEEEEEEDDEEGEEEDDEEEEEEEEEEDDEEEEEEEDDEEEEEEEDDEEEEEEEEEEENEEEEDEEEEEGEKDETEDPYLLKDATYIKKNDLWKMRQKVLIVRSPLKKKNCQSFIDNLKLLLPHHKMESKWSKKEKKIDLSNICYSSNCSNLIFFDIKRNRHCLWICRNKTGPSLYFEILDYIPLHSLAFPGNCLLYSRPLLIFSKLFDELEHLKLIKEMFIQVFGTPKYHPLSKPFYDHCYNFYYIKDLIYFRHYQILPTTLADSNNINKQKLVEIGPQFTLHIIKIFDKFFKGNVIYENLKYKNCETPKQKKIKQNIKKKFTSIKKKKSYMNRIKFIHTPIKTDIDF